MEMQVTFPGGKRVDATYGGFTVRTDQPVEGGGDASAPAPFDLFLASLATCAGIYALGFCQARGLSTEGLRLIQRYDADPTTGLPTRIQLELHLPVGFPERYRPAILRAAEGCKVKKAIGAPPIFEITAVVPVAAEATMAQV